MQLFYFPWLLILIWTLQSFKLKGNNCALNSIVPNYINVKGCSILFKLQY